MKRYYHSEISAKREDALKRFYGFGDSPHYVYAVVARIDHRKNPIYVGETENPRRRFEQHLKVAWGGRDDNSKLGSWERKLIARGGTLEFHALEGCEDRLRALALESAWARAVRRLGHPLANSWPEHRSTASSCLVPNTRLGSMNLRDAMEAKIVFAIRCPSCSTQLELPPTDLLSVTKLNPKISTIAESVNCVSCGSAQKLRVVANRNDLTQRRKVPDRTEQARNFLLGVGIISESNS